MIGFALCALGCLGGYAKVPKNLLPTEKESAAMLREADDFIDELADTPQDFQADAVLHSLYGHFGELIQLRQSLNTPLKLSEGVEVLPVKGDGAARGLNMRLYKPSKTDGKPMPLLVYFHGGGWTVGGLESCSTFCDALAATGSAMVLAVDYSLAPERPYPAGMMDCVSAVEYVFANASELCTSKELISLGGDSAGGNLALATAMYMADSHPTDKIRSLVLFYPVVKAYNDKSASWKRYSRGYGLDGRLLEAYADAYVAKGDEKDPYVSPADADDAKLAALPPVLMVTAQQDILADQSKEFADRLKHADRVELPNTVHLFISRPGQPTAFTKSVALASAFLKK